MTETEWLTCTDPKPMLEFVRGKTSDRKLRLLACACTRRALHLMRHERSRQALRMADRFADGRAAVAELDVARQAARAAVREDEARVPRPPRHDQASALQAAEAAVSAASAAADAAWVPPRHDPVRFAAQVSWHAISALCLADFAAADQGFVKWTDWLTPSAVQEGIHAGLVRDISGNLFRPFTIAPAWLSWRDGLVVRLAQAAYEERELPSGHLDPQRLAVLSDALEEAGADPELVAHLREPGPHVRGCHILDLLLAKE
jgi:hypothetical protein